MMSIRHKFHLYTSGVNGEVKKIVNNLHASLTSILGDAYDLEVKCLFDDGHADHAIDDGVFSIPGLVRKYPEPKFHVVGDLSNAALAGLLSRKIGKQD